MRKVLVLLSLFFTSTISSQSEINKDSLWNVWNDSLQLDSTRMDAVNTLGTFYMYRDPDTSRMYAKIVLDYSSNLSRGSLNVS